MVVGGPERTANGITAAKMEISRFNWKLPG
jgi:hypothetical protein